MVSFAAKLQPRTRLGEEAVVTSAGKHKAEPCHLTATAIPGQRVLTAAGSAVPAAFLGAAGHGHRLCHCPNAFSVDPPVFHHQTLACV